MFASDRSTTATHRVQQSQPTSVGTGGEVRAFSPDFRSVVSPLLTGAIVQPIVQGHFHVVYRSQEFERVQPDSHVRPAQRLVRPIISRRIDLVRPAKGPAELRSAIGPETREICIEPGGTVTHITYDSAAELSDHFIAEISEASEKGSLRRRFECRHIYAHEPARFVIILFEPSDNAAEL